MQKCDHKIPNDNANNVSYPLYDSLYLFTEKKWTVIYTLMSKK